MSSCVQTSTEIEKYLLSKESFAKDLWRKECQCAWFVQKKGRRQFSQLIKTYASVCIEKKFLMVCGSFDLRGNLAGTSGWSMELDDIRLQMQFRLRREQVFKSYNMLTTDHMVGSPSLEVAINIDSGMWKLHISCKTHLMLLFQGVELVD